jgi:histidyl-tRNA synthetase
MARRKINSHHLRVLEPRQHWQQDLETASLSGPLSDAVIMAKDHGWIRLNIVQIAYSLSSHV